MSVHRESASDVLSVIGGAAGDPSWAIYDSGSPDIAHPALQSPGAAPEVWQKETHPTGICQTCDTAHTPRSFSTPHTVTPRWHT